MNINISGNNIMVLGSGHGLGGYLSDAFIRENCRVCGVSKTNSGFINNKRLYIKKI